MADKRITCPPDSTIEMQVLKELYGKPGDRELAAHLLSRPLCARTRLYYMESHSAALAEPDPDMKDWADRIVRTRIVPSPILLRHRPDLMAPRLPDSRETSVAADSPPALQPPHIQPLGVFLSEDESLMVRILCDRKERITHLHVLGTRFQDGIGLKITLLPDQLTGISDHSGHIVFRDVILDDPGHLSVRIIEPFGRIFSRIDDRMETAVTEPWNMVIEDQKTGSVSMGFLAGHGLNLSRIRFETDVKTPSHDCIHIALIQSDTIIECSGKIGEDIPLHSDVHAGPFCISVFLDRMTR